LSLAPFRTAQPELREHTLKTHWRFELRIKKQTKSLLGAINQSATFGSASLACSVMHLLDNSTHQKTPG
tara:strand:+ start:470 stop:676 length:207 start_codon:yes stop_codon:yes gene_type:complete